MNVLTLTRMNPNSNRFRTEMTQLCVYNTENLETTLEHNKTVAFCVNIITVGFTEQQVTDNKYISVNHMYSESV